jgi:hypothetical protein
MAQVLTTCKLTDRRSLLTVDQELHSTCGNLILQNCYLYNYNEMSQCCVSA